MNYTQLVTAIKDFVEVDEAKFNANVDNFIQFAENRIYRTVPRLPCEKKRVTSTLSANTQTILIPDGFISLVKMATVPATQTAGAQYVRSVVRLVDESMIDELNGHFQSQSGTDFVAAKGQPKYIAIIDDDTFLFYPVPDVDYTLSMTYRVQPESIVTANTTWLGDNAPQTLLYGAVLEAYVFLKGDAQLMDAYRAIFSQGINELQGIAKDVSMDESYSV